MAEDGRDKSEERVRIGQLPSAVKRLVDAMIGIDPNFKIEDWLIKKANEDLIPVMKDMAKGAAEGCG